MQNADDLWIEILRVVDEMMNLKVDSQRWDHLSALYNQLCYKHSCACGEILYLTIDNH